MILFRISVLRVLPPLSLRLCTLVQEPIRNHPLTHAPSPPTTPRSYGYLTNTQVKLIAVVDDFDAGSKMKNVCAFLSGVPPLVSTSSSSPCIPEEFMFL